MEKLNLLYNEMVLKKEAFKIGDKVIVRDGTRSIRGTIFSIDKSARTPFVIKKKDGTMFGAREKDINKESN